MSYSKICIVSPGASTPLCSMKISRCFLTWYSLYSAFKTPRWRMSWYQNELSRRVSHALAFFSTYRTLVRSGDCNLDKSPFKIATGGKKDNIASICNLESTFVWLTSSNMISFWDTDESLTRAGECLCNRPDARSNFWMFVPRMETNSVV
jgi:hypothetical protein